MNRSWTTIFLVLCGVSTALGETPVPATIDFNRDVRPILSENCYFCHGPDKNKRKADLRLDTHDGLFVPLKDHPPVVAGDVNRSELLARIIDPDPAQRMPDPKSNKKLADRQIAIIRKWIEQGAPWKDHWAYSAASKFYCSGGDTRRYQSDRLLRRRSHQIQRPDPLPRLTRDRADVDPPIERGSHGVAADAGRRSAVS